jgi:cell division septum initiation protein DivIVA
MSSEAPTPFRTVLRGYEPAQVDQHVRELTTSLTALQQQSEQLQRHVQDLQSRADAAESAVVSAQDNRDRTPTFTEFGERVAKILSLADDEARDLVTRARTDAEGIVADAEGHAKKVRKEAEQYSLDWKSEVDAEAARILDEAQALYEQERAKSAQAAAAFETTLAERRGKVEQEFAARTALAEQQLAAVTDRAAQVQREADRSRSEAERLAQQQLADANRQAQEIVAAAKDKSERIRAESERELAAATQRRDSINAQLTNVRQMLATLSGSPAMPLDLLADDDAETTSSGSKKN